MVLVFLAAVACGIARGSFLAFGIGFVAFCVLLTQLVMRADSPAVPTAQSNAAGGFGPWKSMPARAPSAVVFSEMASAAEAHMLRNYLADHGVDAWVEGDQSVWVYPGLIRPRVLVPHDQLEQARRVLEDYAENGRAEAGAASEERFETESDDEATPAESDR
jgi:hypothetical protein